MKRLFIVRHAKSSWDDAIQTDLQRPLNKRGLRDAPFMAEVFAGKFPGVRQLVSSPAVRTLSTAMAFAKALGVGNDEIRIDEEIYEAPVRSILQAISRSDDGQLELVLFGHNPGVSMLVDYLTGESLRFSTCMIVGVEIDTPSWSAIGRDSARIVFLDYPKNHFHEGE